MSILENAKEIAELVKKLGQIELYRKIVDLENEIGELSRAKNKLESTVEDLKKLLDKKQSLHFKEPFFYVDGDDVPFCPKCWESEEKAIHLTRSEWEKGITRHECKKCGFFHLPKGLRVSPVGSYLPPRPRLIPKRIG